MSTVRAKQTSKSSNKFYANYSMIAWVWSLAAIWLMFLYIFQSYIAYKFIITCHFVCVCSFVVFYFVSCNSLLKYGCSIHYVIYLFRLAYTVCHTVCLTLLDAEVQKCVVVFFLLLRLQQHSSHCRSFIPYFILHILTQLFFFSLSREKKMNIC